MKSRCHILPAVIVLLSLAACREKQEQNIYQFFDAGGGYLIHLPTHCPDSCALKIKNEVPEKWQFIACQSLYYLLPENAPEAFDHLDSFEKTFPSDSMRAFTQQIRGELFADQARFDTARICLNESLRIYQKLKKTKNAGDVKRHLARICLNQGDFPETTHLLLDALELYGKIDSNELDRLFNLRLDLSNAYFAEKEYREALKWSQLAYDFA
ncbi:MAG: tetratricopeptide repeat protein, partial [Bacteroidota bacterium]